jgi:hypothetical protein
MTIIIQLRGGTVKIIDGCCSHDFDRITLAMKQHHTRWLRRRKPSVVFIETAKRRWAVVVSEIASISVDNA